MYIVQKYVRRIQAALKIQKCWKGYKCRSWLQKLKCGLVIFQAHCRGFRIRKMITDYKEKERLIRKPQVCAILKLLNDLISYSLYFYPQRDTSCFVCQCLYAKYSYTHTVV